MKTKILGILAASVLLAGCCSDTPQDVTTNVVVDSQITPGSVNDFVLNVGDRVFFDFDKAELTADAQQTIQRQAEFLKKYADKYLVGDQPIVVVGHCDERGTSEYNKALGYRRAQVVKNYMIKQCGVDKKLISICSKGKDHPLYEGTGEEVWRKNRVSITVIGKNQAATPEAASAPAAADMTNADMPADAAVAQ
jgi:peptidoglycan-associated lipoprotein